MKNLDKISKLHNEIDKLRYELQEKPLYLSSTKDPEREKVVRVEEKLRILGDHLENLQIQLIDLLPERKE